MVSYSAGIASPRLEFEIHNLLSMICRKIILLKLFKDNLANSVQQRSHTDSTPNQTKLKQRPG